MTDQVGGLLEKFDGNEKRLLLVCGFLFLGVLFVVSNLYWIICVFSFVLFSLLGLFTYPHVFAALFGFAKKNHKIPCNKSEDEGKCKVLTVATGNEETDMLVNFMIALFVRDIVEKSYTLNVGKTKVVREAHRLITEAVQKIVDRIKRKNDWTGFFSIRLVNEFSCHLKNYLLTMSSVKHLNLSNCTYDEYVEHFKRNFFTVPQSKSSFGACSNLVFFKSVNSINDGVNVKNFCRGVSKIVAVNFCNKDELNCIPAYNFLVNTFANSVVSTLLSYFSSPDNINMFICKVLTDSNNMYQFSSMDSLFYALRTCNDKAALEVVQNDVVNTMSKMGIFDLYLSNNNNVNNVGNVKKQITFMTEILDKISLRIETLKTGDFTVEIEDMEEEANNTTTFDSPNNMNVAEQELNENSRDYSKILKAPDLTFAYMENNKSVNCFDYFFDFLKAENTIELYHFYDSLCSCLAEFEPKFNSVNFKSGIFLMQDPIVVGYRATLKVVCQGFMETAKNTAPLEALADKHDLFERIIKVTINANEKSANKVDINMLVQLRNYIKENVLVSEEVFGRFKKSRQYITMCVHLNLLSDSCFDQLQEDLTGKNQSVEQLDQMQADKGARTKRVFTSCRIIDIDVQDLRNEKVVLYNISSVLQLNNEQRTYKVYRRYSEFYDFFNYVSTKFSGHFSSFNFPPKSKFHTVDENFLVKRRAGLDKFLGLLVSEASMHEQLTSCMLDFVSKPQWKAPGLIQSLLTGLDVGGGISNTSGGGGLKVKHTNHKRNVSTGQETASPSVKSAKKALKKTLTRGSESTTNGGTNSPMLTNSSANLNGESPVRYEGGSEHSKKLQVNGQVYRNCEVNGKTLEKQTFNYFMTLLEVIGNLKEGAWLRRNFTTSIKQFIVSSYGNKLSKTILGFFQGFVNVETVNGLLQSLLESFWPDGVYKQSGEVSDKSNVLRRRLSSKANLFSLIPNEAKGVLGENYCVNSVTNVHNMFQFEEFNRKLVMSAIVMGLAELTNKEGGDINEETDALIAYLNGADN